MIELTALSLWYCLFAACAFYLMGLKGPMKNRAKIIKAGCDFILCWAWPLMLLSIIYVLIMYSLGLVTEKDIEDLDSS